MKINLIDIIEEQKFTDNTKKDPFGPISAPSKYGAVLIGGLTHGESLSQQIDRLSSATGRKVKGFSHNESMDSIASFLARNINLPIFLFSAGCRRSYEISNLYGVNKNKFYVIEPAYTGGETTTSVRDAVKYGVPASHVFVGPGSSRGQGIVNGASDSKTNPRGCHYCSINSVGSLFGM